MKALINGTWIDKDEKIPVLNPYDKTQIDTVPRCGPAEVEEAMESAIEGLEEMKSLSSFRRYEILQRTAQEIERTSEKLATTLAWEVGKTINEARGEVARTVQTFTWAAEEAKRIHGRTVPFDAAPTAPNKLGFYLRVPVGVVVAITPFNFPLNLAAHKIAPALAAGNSLVLKPASDTPLAGGQLCEILLEAGLPARAINLITGPGGEIGEALVKDHRARMVTFTGSLEVGKRIMARIGMKKATMELGSNSAVILMEDADLERATPRIRLGAFALAGQVCISIQRVYVHERIFDDFLERFLPMVRNMVVGDPLDETTDMGPMISSSAAERAAQWVEEAKKAGGELLLGGGHSGSLFEPTVLAHVPEESAIVRQEAFAPVVVVNSFRTLDEAIHKVNDSPYGLQAGIYTSRISDALAAARRIEVGGVIVNDIPTFRVDLMPYGGVKFSGLGREGIQYAVEEMTEVKLVCFDLAQ